MPETDVGSKADVGSDEVEADGRPEGIWLAQDFNPIQLTQQLQNQLLAEGGSIDQALMFWEHLSASDWYAIANQREYQTGQQGAHYQWIAEDIAWFLDDTFGPDGKNLELIMLGPGHAEAEICLVREILKYPIMQYVHMNLLDISQPLLALGCQNVEEAFQEDPRVTFWAIQGNFYNIRQYKQLLRRSARRPCLVTMVGATLQTIQNESLFIQNSLGAFKTNDLLLVEVSTVYAPVDRPDEILKRDPRFSGAMPKSIDRAYQKFLEGPLRRTYQERLKSISLSAKLDTDGGSIPNSYGVDLRAVLQLTDGTEKEFSMMRFMRYTKRDFIVLFYSKGWIPVCNWDFGPHGDRCAYLFRKQ